MNIQTFWSVVFEVNYEQYKSDEIIVGNNISFMNLKSTIAAEL